MVADEFNQLFHLGFSAERARGIIQKSGTHASGILPAGSRYGIMRGARA